LHQSERFNARLSRGTIFYCRTYAGLAQRSRVLNLASEDAGYRVTNFALLGRDGGE
jgi:hypothetical protein